jgi:hypothetical protein
LRTVLLWTVALVFVFSSSISGAFQDEKGTDQQLLLAEARSLAKAKGGKTLKGDETETASLPKSGKDLSKLETEPIRLENIKPLYTTPGMPGEGIWDSSGSPRDSQGRPLIFRTFYRPSVDFPNAVV